MCGRYSLACPPEELIETFDVPGLTFEHVPRFNVAPGTPCPVVVEDGRGRRIGLLAWGLARWGGGAGRRIVNARAETLAEKPAFREAFRRRRCLVPADGFYEWGGAREARRPWWFHPAGGGLLALAGVWERGAFCVVTTGANEEVRPVHHRMPVLVAPGERSAWLDPASAPERLDRILAPAPAETLAGRPVSTRVNDPTADGPALVEEVE